MPRHHQARDGLCPALQSDIHTPVKALFINFARFHQPIFFQLRFALLCYPLPSNHNVLVQSTPDPRFSQPCTGVTHV